MRLTGLLTTPKAATNPGAFSWRDYLARRAVYGELRVKRPGAAVVLGGGSPNCVRKLGLAGAEAGDLEPSSSSLPTTEAAVLSGILIGRRSDLPPGLLADFVHTGTVHILASAGLHVGIFAFWLERLLQKLTLPRKMQATAADVQLAAVRAGLRGASGGGPGGADGRAVLWRGLV